jgi:hypothetical protein
MDHTEWPLAAIKKIAICGLPRTAMVHACLDVVHGTSAIAQGLPARIAKA